MYGQASPAGEIQALRNQVSAGLAPRATLDQAEAALAAAQDAELLNRAIPLSDLTEEQVSKLEAAARRQLERATARLQQVRTMVEAGLLPAQSLAAPTDEQALAQASLDLTLSRTELVHQLAAMALSEQQVLEASEGKHVPGQEGFPSPAMERFDGDGTFTARDFGRVKSAFESQFHKVLPVSADGETEVHRALGFDHRNRVDVALFPDTVEGQWLRHFLEANNIPYYAFRSMILGKATGAHIHIGPPSTRLIASR